MKANVAMMKEVHGGIHTSMIGPGLPAAVRGCNK
jgi:hypothetical protein